MKTIATHPSKVTLSAAGISICGKPSLILCSSLFYFRIPRDYWQERMQQIKSVGYNTIDVYIPWNFHETKEGQWNFEGERNISAFMDLAAQESLWVIARPGPYICSEWDGGGLPAFLNTKPGMNLRQKNPTFLDHVGQWFDHIFPVLNNYQIDKSGTIIAIQLENELDFYACQDPHGYMTALRDMAYQHAITVPLIACCGQGDIYGATGDVSGIVPTCNIYSNEMDDGVETRVEHYIDLLRHRNYPLLVTETQRQHFYLRRLLSAGAKLLGPYLQVSGTNFDFTNGINNWGTPMSFLTSDYDFGGMISPSGELTPEYYEGRLLGKLIETLGEELAQAAPEDIHKLSFTPECSLVEGGPYILGFPSGGELIALPNTHQESIHVKIMVSREGTNKEYSTFIAPGKCPLLLKDFPLHAHQMDATLCFTTAELLTIHKNKVIVFYSDQEAVIDLEVPLMAHVTFSDMKVEQQDHFIQLKFPGAGITKAILQFPDGDGLIIYGIDREAAKRLIDFDEDDQPFFEEPMKAALEVPIASTSWCANDNNWITEKIFNAPVNCGAQPKHLEEAGILLGIGLYRARVDDTSSPVIGFLIQDASDVLSLYTNGSYQGTVLPAGGSAYLVNSLHTSNGPLDIMVRAEIWGHSNFDDSRLPALRLNALRGLGGLIAVNTETDLSRNWQAKRITASEQKNELLEPSIRTSEWALTSLGGMLSTARPHQVVYRKILYPTDDTSAWVLAFPSLPIRAEVYVDGRFVSGVNPLSPHVDLTANLHAGQPAELAIYVEQDCFMGLQGRLVLWSGIAAQNWTLAGSDEMSLWKSGKHALGDSLQVELPLIIEPGGVGWLLCKLQPPQLMSSGMMRIGGKNAKITAFLNGHLVGRIWLPCDALRPTMVGGVDDRIYLPPIWMNRDDNLFALLVEAIAAKDQATIDRLVIISAG